MDAAETKAALRRDFPDWSIIRSEPDGRWWATRGPQGKDPVQHDASCFEADTAEQLRDKLTSTPYEGVL